MTPSQFRSFARSFGLPRRVALTLLALHLSSTLFEGVGLSMLLPVFQFVQGNGDLARLTSDSRAWELLVTAYDSVGLPVTLVTLLCTAFVSILGRQAFIYLRLVYAARAKENLIRDVCALTFERYLNARTAYQDGEALGEVVNDMTTELRRAVGALFGTIALVGYVFLVAFYLAVLLAVSTVMTLLVLVAFLLSGLVVQRLWRATHATSRQVAGANRTMSSFLVERLRSARLVRLSGTERAESQAMRRLTERQRDHMVSVAMLVARVEVVIEPLVVAIGFMLLYVGVTTFSLAIEQIGLFLLIVVRLLPVVKEILRSRQNVLSTLGSLEAVEGRIAALKLARESGSGNREFLGVRERIAFEDVGFDYAGLNTGSALDGVDAVFPARSMTALVGPSGGGKSTLVDLLPRLREPSRGRILIDGVPITEFTLESLRRKVAYAPQSPQLFDISAADHIRLGRSDATPEQVRAAANLAGADEFISNLPHGYETRLGEDGSRLSGGQRQRLDLARALVREAAILILDEPTSNLDAESEAQFRAAVQRIRRETATTIVIIGHRLSTISDADQIVVLDAGRIVERGTHADLLDRNGWYAMAWDRQVDSVATDRQAAVS